MKYRRRESSITQAYRQRVIIMNVALKNGARRSKGIIFINVISEDSMPVVAVSGVDRLRCGASIYEDGASRGDREMTRWGVIAQRGVPKLASNRHLFGISFPRNICAILFTIAGIESLSTVATEPKAARENAIVGRGRQLIPPAVSISDVDLTISPRASCSIFYRHTRWCTH